MISTREKAAEGAFIAGAVRVSLRRDPACGHVVTLTAGLIDIGCSPIQLTEAQLPAARKLVADGLDAIAGKLAKYHDGETLLLAQSTELTFSAMLSGSETLLVLATPNSGRAVAVPAARGAELYLALRVAESRLFRTHQ